MYLFLYCNHILFFCFAFQQLLCWICSKILAKLSYYILAVIFVKTKIGGDKEIRTPDPLLARQVLSQLSYAPISIL